MTRDLAPKWILDDVVVAIHRILLATHGGSDGLRDHGLLESALGRPRNLLAYESKSSIFRLAAAYAFGLIKNHTFIDGNKRVALTICFTFLELNGFFVDADEAESVLAFTQLASGDLSESDFALWLANKARSV